MRPSESEVQRSEFGVQSPVPAASRSANRSAWRRWLIDVERGLSQSFRGESTLFGYCFVATVVITTGVVLGISIMQWAVVALALSVAASAEMFQMVLRAIWSDLDSKLSKETKKALQIGSAAVVVTRTGAMMAIVLIYGAKIAAVL